jgi:hypothetical protein
MMGIWVVSRTNFTKKEISPLIISKSAFQIERIIVRLCRSKVLLEVRFGELRVRRNFNSDKQLCSCWWVLNHWPLDNKVSVLSVY